MCGLAGKLKTVKKTKKVNVKKPNKVTKQTASFCSCEPKEGNIYRVLPRERQLYRIFKGLNLTARRWGKFIKKLQSSKAGTFFFCAKPQRGKYLTVTEMKHLHHWFSPHNDFCFSCKTLKNTQQDLENLFCSFSFFCLQEIWFRSPLGPP